MSISAAGSIVQVCINDLAGRDALLDRSLDEQNRTSLCQHTVKPDITRPLTREPRGRRFDYGVLGLGGSQTRSDQVHEGLQAALSSGFARPLTEC
jgi:hypothetical protein